MHRRHLIFAFLSMAMAVSLGALGAHFLKARLSPELIDSFQTGVRYQVYHGLAIIGLVALSQLKSWNFKPSLILFELGIVLFSFSIYLLSTRSLFSPEASWSWLGPITPLGGLALILGWILAAIQVIRIKSVD